MFHKCSCRKVLVSWIKTTFDRDSTDSVYFSSLHTLRERLGVGMDTIGFTPKLSSLAYSARGIGIIHPSSVDGTCQCSCLEVCWDAGTIGDVVCLVLPCEKCLTASCVPTVANTYRSPASRPHPCIRHQDIGSCILFRKKKSWISQNKALPKCREGTGSQLWEKEE